MQRTHLNPINLFKSGFLKLYLFSTKSPFLDSDSYISSKYCRSFSYLFPLCFCNAVVRAPFPPKSSHTQGWAPATWTFPLLLSQVSSGRTGCEKLHASTKRSKVLEDFELFSISIHPPLGIPAPI